ncbi:MAG: hypothetical protein OXF79_10515 [Chloroflexi bacterium]|nr:hypothetical protein [Chloroflexota bacterium]
MICLKNIGAYATTAIVFYGVGYNLMFVGMDDGGWIGSPTLLFGTTAAERALLGGNGVAAAVVDSGRAAMADWLFQMVFVGSVASIVSGTLAERVRLHSFLLFVAILAAFIYPTASSATGGASRCSKRGPRGSGD